MVKAATGGGNMCTVLPLKNNGKPVLSIPDREQKSVISVGAPGTSMVRESPTDTLFQFT
jgi:hypothetical protein